MKTLLSLAISILFIGIGYSQTNKTAEDLIAQLEKKVPAFMEQQKVPGMAIAVIDNGNILYQKAFGFSNIELQKELSVTTGFNIGSISKLFTAIAIMKLVEEGALDLDVPVETYLTRWQLPDTDHDKRKVSIRGLLNHTAGISVHGYPGFTGKEQLPSLEASLNGENGPARANEKVEVIIAPNTAFKYSGGGYTILQLVIEEVTQMSFQKYMHKSLFKPLKMKDSSFKITNKVLKTSAIPYDNKQQKLPFEFFTAQGAAGLHTTLHDFLLFATEILTEHKIVSEKTIQEMIIPTEVSGENYGLGFMQLKLGPFQFIGHAGSNTGWQSAFFADFTKKSGIIMMCNGDEGVPVLQNTLRTWATWKYKD